MLTLFEKYPHLKEKVPYVSIGEFPTPVEKMQKLGQLIDAPGLFVKREDLSGRRYGGNKIRALEFLFGDALQKGYQEVIAFGFPASCQALAQAIHAPSAGLQTIAFLGPQMKTEQARRHLLAYQGIHADVRPALPAFFFYLIRYYWKQGRFPKLLEASSPVGMIGYVNAGFELQNQVQQGLLPEPDLVYVAMATLGTAIGLMLGLKAAGLRSRVVAVDLGAKMLGRKLASFPKVTRLFQETNNLLYTYDVSFPRFTITEDEFQIRFGYQRPKDSLITPAGVRAMKRLKETENLQLDEMFTGNAFAALMDDGQAGQLQDRTVLWWNSYNSRELPLPVSTEDYSQLPAYFHRYFVD